jgi:hypothetical protein
MMISLNLDIDPTIGEYTQVKCFSRVTVPFTHVSVSVCTFEAEASSPPISFPSVLPPIVVFSCGEEKQRADSGLFTHSQMMLSTLGISHCQILQGVLS